MRTSPTTRADRPPTTTRSLPPAPPPALLSALLPASRAALLSALFPVVLGLLLLPTVPTLLDGIHSRSRRLAGGREAGVSVVEWLLITTIIAGAALAIGAIVIAKLTSKANELDLTTP